MPHPTDPPRVPGWERVLNAFMAAPDRTLTNVQLGQVPGVQAFHQRIQDMRRYGYIVTDGVLVKKGRYAYTLLGVHAGMNLRPDGKAHPQQAGPVIADADVTAADLAAVEKTIANAEKLAKLEGTPALPTPTTPRAVRDAVAMLQQTLGDHTADWPAADRDDVLSLVHKVVELREDSREVIAEMDRQITALTVERDALRATAAGAGPALIRRALEWCEQPMHYKRIAAYVMENGGDAYYKGASPATTIVRHLVKSDKDPAGAFVKVASGVFALREWADDGTGKPRCDEFGNELLKLEALR